MLGTFLISLLSFFICYFMVSRTTESFPSLTEFKLITDCVRADSELTLTHSINAS